MEKLEAFDQGFQGLQNASVGNISACADFLRDLQVHKLPMANMLSIWVLSAWASGETRLRRVTVRVVSRVSVMIHNFSRSAMAYLLYLSTMISY